MRSFASGHRRPWKWLLLAFLGVILIVLASNLVVLAQGSEFCFSEPEKLAATQMAVLLGTDHPAAILRRSNAARALLEKKIVSRILVSGNPQNRGQNEVELNAGHLKAAGVEVSSIDRDETGINTRRTIEHVRTVSGTNRVIFVTDDYHSARTMFLARHAGLDATCFTSNSGWANWVLVKVHLREYLARTKAVIETYLLGY